MRIELHLVAAFVIATGAFSATHVHAHSGGQLDLHGCHRDSRERDYHCHSGELSGHSFPTKGEMRRRVEAGEEFEPVEKPNLLNRVLFRDRKEEAAAEAQSGESDNDATVSDPGAAAAPPVQSAPGLASAPTTGPDGDEIERRLRVLKGLHEMELITEEEYAARRKAILDDL